MIGDFIKHRQETVNEEKIGINDRLKASAWKELGKLPFDFELSKIKLRKLHCKNYFRCPRRRFKSNKPKIEIAQQNCKGCNKSSCTLASI